MRILQLILVVLLMTSLPAGAQSPDSIPSAIEVFKQHEKVQAMMASHAGDQYELAFTQLDMGGNCGIVGCTWQKLVSMVITANRANAPTLTILAVVSGNIPDRGAKPTVRFVDLTDMDPTKWTIKL